MAATVCCVCASQDTKYKCPNCKLPSCSLDCFKQHKTACSATKRPPSQSEDEIASTGLLQMQLETSSALVDPSNLHSLFEQYPDLRTQLQQVYLSTKDPSVSDTHAGVSNRADDRPSNRFWKPEYGFRAGLRTLDKSLQDENVNSAGLNAFLKLLAEKSL